MATTIYTYLHNDDLGSSKIISMDDCMCKLYDIRRDDTAFLNSFKEELQKPALYILLDKKTLKAYIGETDDALKRVQQHSVQKKFWTDAMVFMSSDANSLSKTEVQYLEFLAIKQASSVKTYNLSENYQSGKEPYMSYIQRSRTDKFFKYVQFLSKFVGCDIFEQRSNVALITELNYTEPKVVPIPVHVTREDLSGRVKMSLNGRGKYNKREMALAIVREYITVFPETTYQELCSIFRTSYLERL